MNQEAQARNTIETKNMSTLVVFKEVVMEETRDQEARVLMTKDMAMVVENNIS